MTDYLASVTLKATSGLAEDDITNTFALKLAVGWDPATELLDVTGPLAGFYTSAVYLGSSVEDYIGPSISRTALAHEIRIYELTGHLDGSPHGSPIAEDRFGFLHAAPADELPRETAFVLTLRAEDWQVQPVERPDGADAGAERDRPKQRYSGRVYLGPIAGNADAMVANVSRPEAGFATTVRNAANKLNDDLEAAGHAGLAVWSRKDQALRVVTHIETDDAWDTQRRRGASPTARTTLLVG